MDNLKKSVVFSKLSSESIFVNMLTSSYC